MNGVTVFGFLFTLIGIALLIAAGFSVKVFFLGCVIVAGVFGAVTVGRKILYIQALPAAIGLMHG